jgi:hypothetical protein
MLRIFLIDSSSGYNLIWPWRDLTGLFFIHSSFFSTNRTVSRFNFKSAANFLAEMSHVAHASSWRPAGWSRTVFGSCINVCNVWQSDKRNSASHQTCWDHGRCSHRFDFEEIFLWSTLPWRSLCAFGQCERIFNWKRKYFFSTIYQTDNGPKKLKKKH